MPKATKELNALNDEGLKKRREEMKIELMKNYAQVATGTVPKNPGEIKRARKTVARIETILNQRRSEKKG